MSQNVLVYSLWFLALFPPPPEASWKIAFVLHLGRSFQLQMQCEVGELVLQRSNQGAHLGLRSDSGGDLMLRYNNVAGPGPLGEDQSFLAWECDCECGGQVAALAFSFLEEPGGNRVAPILGAGACLLLSLLPWGQPHLELGSPSPVGTAGSSLQGGHPLRRRNVWVWLKRVHWKESVTCVLKLCLFWSIGYLE